MRVQQRKFVAKEPIGKLISFCCSRRVACQKSERKGPVEKVTKAQKRQTGRGESQ